jgi:hypothetical protein
LGIHKDFNSQSGNLFGSVWVHPFTFFHTPENANVIPRLHFWSAPFHVFALVANARLRS